MSAVAYTRCVLDLYLSMPDTPTRARPADRQLAATLQQQGIPLDLIAAAFVLATARRHSRDPEAPALPPVRSLHYYLPVIEELLANPPAAGYCESLRRRLAPHAPGLLAEIDHQVP
jgi:hypothetical protein